VSEPEEVEDQWVQEHGLDAGGGSECLELGQDWVAYLAEAEIPGNVSGVDESIEDFTGDPGGQGDQANV
jgi:hypothetical protein